MHRGNSLAGLAIAAGAGVLLAASSAGAQSFVHRPGDHASGLEVELHGIIAYSVWGNATAPGVGLRFGIPLMRNGFIGSINNGVALGIGADLYFWPDWVDQGHVHAFRTGLSVPVMLQWSFYLAEHFSFFIEGGVAATFGFWDGYYNDCGSGAVVLCYLTPGAAIGGRWHWTGGARYPAFTFRVGFPSGLTLGISF